MDELRDGILAVIGMALILGGLLMIILGSSPLGGSADITLSESERASQSSASFFGMIIIIADIGLIIFVNHKNTKEVTMEKQCAKCNKKVDVNVGFEKEKIMCPDCNIELVEVKE